MHHRPSFGPASTRASDAKRKRFAFQLGTCLTGAAAALLVAAPASAQEACGPRLTLTAVDCPAGADYSEGIAYSLPYEAPAEDLTVHLGDGIQVATDGDYKNGITVTNFAGGAVSVIADGASSVSTNGNGSIGVAAIAMNGDVSVQVGDVHTSGGDAHGIVAGTPMGAVDVHAGTVVTEGDGAFGIHASGYQGPVSVTAASVQTSGYYATGVSAHSSGNVQVDLDSVATSGDFSVGIDAQAGLPPLVDYDTGEVTLGAPADLTVHAGTVSTQGYGSDGVLAVNFTKGQTTVEVGSIKTTGDNSWGAYAGGFGDVSLSVGATETSGMGAVGLGAVTFEGNIAVSGDTLATHGDFATGVNVLNYNLNGATTISLGSVVTDGDRSTGIYMGGAYFDGNEGQVTTITADHVETHGATSTGVAILTGGDVNVTLGDVVAEGDQSRGVVISNGLGNVTLSIDSIVTKGQSQLGRDTAGLVVQNNHGTVDATIGSIEAASHHAPAILTNGYDSNQNFTVTGSLTTSGPYASAFQGYVDQGSITADIANIATDGAYSNGVMVGVSAGDISVRTGTVATKGDYSAGISAQAISSDGLAHQISIDGGTITTQGANSAGIDVAALGADAHVAAAAIATSGTNSAGVDVLAVAGVDYYGNSFGGNVDIDVGTVKTTGDGAPGISAMADGALTIHAVSVTTEGVGSHGVAAVNVADGGTTGIDVGSVRTSGDYAAGIYAFAPNGDITIHADSVETGGLRAPGVIAATAYGNIAIDVGSVVTGGDDSPGIYSYAGGKQFSGLTTNAVTAGEVTTSGANATGIATVSLGQRLDTIVDAGSVTTHGDGAVGIRAITDGRGNAISITADTVSTDGAFADGINAINYTIGGKIDIAAGSVTTHGYGSAGVFAYAYNADTHVSVDHVATTGDLGFGVSVSGGYGDVTVDAGTIETTGFSSFGISASGQNVTINADSVSTKGETGVGISAGALDTVLINAGSVTTADGLARGIDAGATHTTIVAGDVTTSGTGSTGIYAIGYSAKGSVDVTVNGAVTIGGDYALGVAGLSGGTVAIHNNGSIVTQGTGGRGISAFAYGDIAIDGTGSIETHGLAAQGIYAFSNDGSIDIAQGAISTEGDRATGIYASTLTGDVSITAGDIATKGDLAAGVSAYSASGAVSVTTTGAVSTAGAYSYGVLAFGGGTVSIDNQGSVETSGFSAQGLYALGRGDGTTTVTNSGSVAVSGDYSSAIRAIGSGDVTVASTGAISGTGDYVSGVIGVVPRGGRGEREAAADAAAPMLNIDVKSVTLSGDHLAGIIALNYRGDVQLNAGSVKLDGIGTAITATGAGSVDVTVGDIASGGRGALLIAGGSATLTVTGDVVTPNHVALEMGATGGQTVLNVAQGATVTGGGLRNPADDPYTGPGNAVILGSDMGVVVNNAGTIRNLGDRYTIFVTDIYGYDSNGEIGPVPGVGAVIDNSGVIEGNLHLTAGDDIVTNSGTFVATKDSVFGDGDDRFVNTGVVKVAAAPVPAGTARAAAAAGTNVTLSGLETFENRGTIDLRNGVAGDTLTLPGDFIGSGASTLAVDVGASGADSFVVEGAATGKTAVLINADPKAATLLSKPIEIVKTGAGSSADAFTLASENVGLIRYGLAFDAASGTFSVNAQAGGPVYRLAKLNEGAQAIWQQSALAWSTHMAQLRDAGTSNGLWGQMFGGVVNRDGAIGANNLDYRQDFYGGQLGYDLGGNEGEAGSFTFGVTGGYLNSHQNFKAAADRVTFDAVNFGGYGSFRSGPVFANLLAQYDHYWVKAHDRTANADWKDSVGGNAYGAQAEIGARLGSDALFAEPVVSLAWQHSDIGTIEAFGQTIDFDGNNALTGKAGARVGGSVSMGGGTTGVFYLRGNYVHEFDGKAGLLFTSGGISQAIANPRAGDHGEGALGLNILSEGPVSGFIEGDAIFGSGAKGGGGRVGIRMKF